MTTFYTVPNDPVFHLTLIAAAHNFGVSEGKQASKQTPRAPHKLETEAAKMSTSAFLAGIAVGGVRYGYVKFQLHERENVVQYSVNAVKQSFRGQPKVSQRVDERYVAIPSREHEYYTFIRESWNSKVLCFRNTVLDILHAKK